MCGKNNGCIRTKKTDVTSNYTSHHFLQPQEFADTVAFFSSFATAAVAGCQTNLANSFHNLGGLDLHGLMKTRVSKPKSPANPSKCNCARASKKNPTRSGIESKSLAESTNATELNATTSSSLLEVCTSCVTKMRSGQRVTHEFVGLRFLWLCRSFPHSMHIHSELLGLMDEDPVVGAFKAVLFAHAWCCVSMC